MQLVSEDTFCEAWYPMAASQAVKKGKTIPIKAFSRHFLLYRDSHGHVGAIERYCSHFGTDLSKGKVVGKNLRCPMHHWQFNKSGKCVHIPVSSKVPPKAHLFSFKCEEAYGIIFIYLGQEPPPLPGLLAENGLASSKVFAKNFAFSYQAMAMNIFDDQHLATVHKRSLTSVRNLHEVSPGHLKLDFFNKINGDRLNDRFLRFLGIKEVKVKINAHWANIHFFEHRILKATTMLASLPIDGTNTKVFILTLKKGQSLMARFFAFIQQHMSIAFVKPDVYPLTEARLKIGLLLPGDDSIVKRWLQYFRALKKINLKQKLKRG